MLVLGLILGVVAGGAVAGFSGAFVGVFPNRGSFNYENVMPNLQARFAVRDDLVLRAAFTSTLGRPRYENAAPKSTLTYLPDVTDPNPSFPYSGMTTVWARR